MSEDLDHIVNDAFENAGSKDRAPEMAWSAISYELSRSKVDTAVKESFEGQQDTAPEMVWERVQDQLDIDRVWTRIMGRIYIQKRFHFLRYAAVLLILLLPFHLDFDFFESNSAEGSVSHPHVSTAPVQRNTNSKEFVQPTNATETSAQNASVKNVLPSPTPIEDITSDNGDDLATNNTLKRFQALPGTLALATLEPHREDFSIPSFEQPKPQHSLGLTIGGISSLENTWILDNETREGFDSESLVENEIALGASYGVFAEYQLRPRLAITAEYLFQSRTNQRTNYYNHGTYTNKVREINHSKLSLLLGWNSQPHYFGVSHSTVARLGAYYSRVKSDYTYNNGFLTDINSVYQRSDAGLRMELGKRIYWKSLQFEGGLVANYGMINLASSKSYIPSHLNFTRLVSGGLYLRAGYTL
ncbi:MAG: porin family protein [bacterium]|nr:porin family protein [bacterium]